MPQGSAFMWFNVSVHSRGGKNSLKLLELPISDVKHFPGGSFRTVLSVSKQTGMRGKMLR